MRSLRAQSTTALLLLALTGLAGCAGGSPTVASVGATQVATAAPPPPVVQVVAGALSQRLDAMLATEVAQGGGTGSATGGASGMAAAR